MDHVQASIHFLAHNELYLTEQPYSLRYTGEDRIARTNIVLDRHDDILIHDIRGRESDFSLGKNGFTISQMYSRMQYHDFDDPDRVIAIYLTEIASHLKELLGARHVQVYEHLVSPLIVTGSWAPSKASLRSGNEILDSRSQPERNTLLISRHRQHISVCQARHETL